MRLIRNKKAVEGLPLKYIIIALVAAICVAIVLNVTGILKVGILSTAEKINQSTTEQTTCALDTAKPVIADDGTTCADGKLDVEVSMKDDCGVNPEAVGFFTNTTDDVDYFIELEDGTATDGTWTYSGTDTTAWDGKVVSITVWADDDAANSNRGTKTFAVTCS